jgi:hypothetical protein
VSSISPQKRNGVVDGYSVYLGRQGDQRRQRRFFADRSDAESFPPDLAISSLKRKTNLPQPAFPKFPAIGSTGELKSVRADVAEFDGGAFTEHRFLVYHPNQGWCSYRTKSLSAADSLSGVFWNAIH